MKNKPYYQIVSMLTFLAVPLNASATIFSYDITQRCTARTLGQASTTNTERLNSSFEVKGNRLNWLGKRLICNGKWQRRNVTSNKEIRAIGKVLGGVVNNLRGGSKIKCSVSKGGFSFNTIEEWVGDAKAKDKNIIYDSGQMISRLNFQVKQRGSSCRITYSYKREINARKNGRKTATGGTQVCRVVKSSCSVR